MQLVFYALTLVALWAGVRLIRPMEAVRPPR